MNEDVGDIVATLISSATTDSYPLLICLTLRYGQITVESVIRGSDSPDQALHSLIGACEAFDARVESLPASSIAMLEPNWDMWPSMLRTVPEGTSEFRDVVQDFSWNPSSIVRIERIENPEWFLAYFNQKCMVDARLGRTDTEQLLFHGCSHADAQGILREGFDHRRIGTHGERMLSERSASSSTYFRCFLRPWILLLE